MCDLWKNTTDERVPVGSIPEQIDFAFEQMPTLRSAKHIKLYNSGNFFDAQAIPPDDWKAIADRASHFDSVIVENHPKLCSDKCLEFRDLLGTQLEVAIGLETIHPDVLPKLNKQMTADDFQRAVGFLVQNEIRVRTFILLRPPFLTEAEGIDWALKSVEFAFDCGVSCSAVIPTRAGNGMMEQLAVDGHFEPPTIASMESVLEAGIAMNRGRVFVDLWDAEQFCDCSNCAGQRIERLNQMNLTQQVHPSVSCICQANA
jgi:radical SAM enzyme (TIGR01210 family)